MIFAVQLPPSQHVRSFRTQLISVLHIQIYFFSPGLIDRCYAHEIKSVADAIVEQGLHALGYQFVNPIPALNLCNTLADT
jgi:hypothetical protein